MTKPLQDGEKRVYGARVKDKGADPKWGGKFHRVRTKDNPNGQWGTRAKAKDALDRALANDKSLIGHTFDEVIKRPLTLRTVKVDQWLEGNVVDPADVPEEFRKNYTDTIRRAALAAARFGHVVHVNSSFRFRAEQEHLYDLYLHHGGALAAKPGTSPHERGIALDIPNARVTPGLIRELRALELIDDVPSEVWHVTNHAV
jgi:hypothetical protein